MGNLHLLRLLVLTTILQLRSIFLLRCIRLLHSPSPTATQEGCVQRTSEVVSNIGFKRRPTRTNSDSSFPALNPVADAKPSVLLVGRETSWASPLLGLIEEFGAERVLVSPLNATSAYVKRSGHALVLLDSSVPPEQRKQLFSLPEFRFSMPTPLKWVAGGCPLYCSGRIATAAPPSERASFPLHLRDFSTKGARAPVQSVCYRRKTIPRPFSRGE